MKRARRKTKGAGRPPMIGSGGGDLTLRVDGKILEKIDIICKAFQCSKAAAIRKMCQAYRLPATMPPVVPNKYPYGI